jgi:hypothetical protein
MTSEQQQVKRSASERCYPKMTKLDLGEITTCAHIQS